MSDTQDAPILNTDRLNILADLFDHIAQTPSLQRRYNQSQWDEYGVQHYLDKELDDFDLVAYSNCGTNACIAGHAVIMFGTKEGLAKHTRDGLKGISVMKYGVELLGLNPGIQRELFLGKPFGARADAQPDEAAHVLRNLADTGEVEWKMLRSEHRQLKQDYIFRGKYPPLHCPECVDPIRGLYNLFFGGRS